MTLFNYEKFTKEVKKLSSDYLLKFPYPYAVIDNLFDDKILDLVNEEVELADFEVDSRVDKNVQVKIRSDFADNEALPQVTKSVFDVINGGKFLKILSTLTGIDGLISDPYYDGGGINIIKNEGTLAVHVDGTTQDRMKLSRRINVILFLNDQWDEKWNGYHEQWDMLHKDLSPNDAAQDWRCVRKILPKKGRLLIFTTNDHSWHGHAGVLNVPEHVQRKTLIAYYYTVSRPETDLVYGEPHRAIFINNKITLKEESFKDIEVIL